MMKKPLVSIVISTYNRANVLENAVLSALKQSYKNKEIIISDDYSSDHTKEIGQNLAKKYDNVKYFRNATNLKTAGNWKNAFFKYASGDYITVLNDDDEFLDDKFIEDSIELFCQKDIVCVFSNVLYKIYYEKLDFYEKKFSYEGFESLIDGKKLFFSDDFLHTDNGAIYKKDAILDLKLFEHTIHTLDVEMLYKLMLKGNFAYLPRATYLHNLDQECLGRANSKKFIDSLVASSWVKVVYEFYVDKFGKSKKIDEWFEKKAHRVWKSLLHLVEFDYEEYVDFVLKKIPLNSKIYLFGKGRNLNFLDRVIYEKREDIEVNKIQHKSSLKTISKDSYIVIGINDYIKTAEILFYLLEMGYKEKNILNILSYKKMVKN